MLIEFSLKNGILYGPYPDGIEIDLSFVKQTVKERVEFVKGKNYPAIIDTTGVKSATKEARDYFALPEASEGLIAAAILAKSRFSAFLSNFFIKISLIKSPIPIKLFSDEATALQWLEQFK